MPIKDTEYTVHFWVENISSTDGHGKNTGVTGETTTSLANLKILQDGNISAATVNSTTFAELNTTDAPGWYSLVISNTQNDGDFMNLVGVSTTANVVVHPVGWTNDDDPETIYYADIRLDRDTAGSGNDEYTVIWYKYGTVLTTGVTTPQIYVFNRAGSDLITSGSVMTEIGFTGVYYFDADGTAGKLKMTTGESIIVQVSATIDSATRIWKRVIGRDS